jgi:hypothetical protein
MAILRSRAGNSSGRTAIQKQKTALTRPISKPLPASYKGKQSRPLVAATNACYRRATFQSLLHCPKIINWIATHNEEDENKVVTYACHYADPQDCPACCFKRLATEYWKQDSTAAELDPLVHDFDNSLFSPKTLRPCTFRPGTQECASEFTEHILRAFKHSTVTNQQLWRNQYNALFRLNYRNDIKCSECGRLTQHDESDRVL